MRQEDIGYSKEQEKFEDGVLRADACAERYSSSRDSQYRTSFEDLPSYSFGSSALRKESRIMGKVYRLISAGLKPGISESLENFVRRHSDVLEEEVI